MKIAIHQPHYFPWMGYLDKMAKADKFVILDEVQITKGSNMYRNKFLCMNGEEKYLTICYEKERQLELRFNEIKLKPTVNWQLKQANFLKENYGKLPYFNQIWEEIKTVFEKKYHTILEVDMDSIMILKNMFQIPTELVFQSEIDYPKEAKKDDLVLELCKVLQADIYLSGNGARNYMDIKKFKEEGIKVMYQTFLYPEYPQNKDLFVPNLSALDILFHCGIEEAREIFWSHRVEETEYAETEK